MFIIALLFYKQSVKNVMADNNNSFGHDVQSFMIDAIALL